MNVPNARQHERAAAEAMQQHPQDAPCILSRMLLT
jgi:hypothetical protein